MFDIGQKVVCVADADFPTDGTNQHPRKGQFYTIRWIGDRTHWVRGVIPAVMLHEIHNGIQMCGCGCGWGEIAFAADRFRPLTKRDTDISELQALLLSKELEIVE